MSEYQYYEFQAVDRPLSEADRAVLRSLSTRARITSTSFTNHYEWGDFGGDPAELMARWFDLHCYVANWGTRRLMMRLPRKQLDSWEFEPFLRDVDWADVRPSGDNWILDLYRDEVDLTDHDWDDGSGWLAALTPLRADILSGDMRLFYLLWLTAVEEDAFEDDQPEPLPGIGPLTGGHDALARFFGLDRDLVAAAAEVRGADSTIPPDTARQMILSLPEEDKTTLLLRLFAGEPHLSAELKSRVRAFHGASAERPDSARRTVGELRRRAKEIRDEREQAERDRLEAARRKETEEAEKARRARLDVLRRRGLGVWREIESEVERRNAGSYDKAACLLRDLQALAEENGAQQDYAARLRSLRERHVRKGSFIERLDKSGLA